MSYPSEVLPRWIKRYEEKAARGELSRNQMRTLCYYRQRFLATPKWANHREMAYIYKRARDARRPFAGAIHRDPSHPANVTVDHIVPLKHPHVCGLHCEDNLEIIHHLENQKKGNRCWPDMWTEQCVLELQPGE